MGEIKFGKLIIYIAMIVVAVLAVGGFSYYYGHYK